MNFSSEKMSKIKPSGIRELFAKAQGVPGVISLGIGAPDVHTPEKLKQALVDAVNQDYNNYDQTPGNAMLREAISQKYKNEYQIDYDPQNEVIVTSGGCELVYVALQAFVGEGDEVLLQDPSFLTYERQITLAGGKGVWMPSTEDFRIDIEKTKELINAKTKAIILNFPSNPTGAMMNKDELQALVDLATDHDLLILSDEVYEYYVYDGHKHIHIASLNGAYERTITINSFSKSYCVPGWRMGFGVANKELMAPILGYHSFVVANATTPTQVALANFIETPEAKEFVQYVRKEFQHRRDLIVKGFNSIDGMKCVQPEGAFYCYPDISETKYPDATEFSNKIFEEAKVVFVPGTEFGPTQQKYVRASFGSVNEEQINTVIERLQNVLT